MDGFLIIYIVIGVVMMGLWLATYHRQHQKQVR